MSDQNQALAVQPGGMFAVAPSSIFDNLENLGKYEKMAEALAASSFIPEAFQKKPAECLIALEYASNLGMRVLMVMQNLHVVKGKPSWDGKFIGSVIKSCGRFRNMRYVMGEAGVVAEAYVQGAYEPSPRKVLNVPNLTCYVSVTDVATGDEIRGTLVSIQMAVAEGWYGGKGSKWPNMPEQMLQYRAASFFGRIHVQDILLGMHTSDEVADMQPSYADAGTGAVEIMEGVTGDAPQRRQRRQGAAAPTPVVPRPVEPITEAEVQSGINAGTESFAREIMDEDNSAPVAAPEPTPEAEPATVAVAPVHVAPAAMPAQETEPAAYEFTPETMRVLIALTKDPVVGNLSESDAALLKAFGAVYPQVITLPRTRRGKAEFSALGNEWLAEQTQVYDTLKANQLQPSGLPLADAEDLEAAGEAQTTAAGDAPAMTAQPGGLSQAEINQATRNATAAQQYPETPAVMLGPDTNGKFHPAGSPGALAAWPLTGNPAKEQAAAADLDSVPTPLADAVKMPTGSDSVMELFDLPN